MVNELNIEFPVKLFELMSDISKNTLFIQASTEWVYGNKGKASKKIDSYNLSEKNLGAYAYSKLICERELENRATENTVNNPKIGIIYALEDDRCNSFINKVLESQRGKEFICKSGESARRYVGIKSSM